MSLFCFFVAVSQLEHKYTLREEDLSAQILYCNIYSARIMAG